MTRHRILVLGGTTEARLLTERLAARPEYDSIVSLAGRTREPKPLALPTRHGGFGGVEGLAAYIQENGIALVVDATHPFASQISANAAQAAEATGVPLFALCRSGWEQQDGDIWQSVGSVAEAVDTLGNRARRVFLAIGRQEAYQFSRAPQHAYLVRSIDPVEPPLAVPDCQYILSAGPFTVESERRLLSENGIELIVSKNSGGDATYGKIAAARALGIPVIMVERKPDLGIRTVQDADAALAMIDQLLAPVVKRGV